MKRMPMKMKIIMIGFILLFMFFYMIVFGSSNAVIGVMIAMAGLMNIRNDLSYKPKLSFIKVLSLLLILGIVAYLNNPITIFGCILTFVVVFGTTMTSYHLFSADVYLPYLMCYFMMMSIPVSLSDLPIRLLSLAFGAVFIVGINLLANRNKQYKLSKQTIDSLTDEINNAVDLKLSGKEVTKDSFKTANGFYSSIFSQFEYKYFSSPIQESVLNVVKSFQYIGSIIADYDLTRNELEYIKKILSNIDDSKSFDVFKDFEVETKEMNVVLLNFENIIDEINNANLSKEAVLPDKEFIKPLIIPSIKRNFSFRSVKFTFAFKMAITLTLWEVLTLVFNLPFTKWLYFATIPLMMPYVDDLAYTAKSRLRGTLLGVFVFAILILILPYFSISPNAVMLIVMVVCMIGMVYYLEDKLIMTIFTTIMSVMTSLMYITPDLAMELKLLWVGVAVVVVTAINFWFLPYSVEKETENNLKLRFGLNKQSVYLVRDKCLGNISSKKTSLLVVSNIVGENIEVTDKNEELFDLQRKITDTCNFILTYLDKHQISDSLKENLIDIIDNGGKVNDNLNNNDKVISYSMSQVMESIQKENEMFRM
ncbi:FUSC family protein [Methanobrevibacter sp.]|uniref:FUSC family protein n=1 Tax=Methanobrevibacter sp. TaxID=66852 RepID=UPI00388E8EBD